MPTGEREIDPVQAAIVRRIFQEYAEGLAPRRIAGRLNMEKIPGPRGGLWNASTINGSRQRRNGILNNELYTGTITYNRQRFVKNPDTGKRISRLNPETEWVKTQVRELRIIDDESWKKVQEIKARYSSLKGNKRQTKKRLLTGLVKCGSCGGAMTIVNRNRYYCSAKRERGTCNSTVGIKVQELEDRILTGLRDILVGKEGMIEVFVEEFKAEVARLRKTRGALDRQVQQDLNKVNTAIKRCLRFITEGDGDPGLVRDELRSLEDRKRSLEQAQKISVEEALVEVHPNIADLYAKKVINLQSLLEDDVTCQQATDLVRSMVDRVDVAEGVERGKPEVTLVGTLAAILDYASQIKTATSDRDGGRVLMVAGVGFEPTTFRL